AGVDLAGTASADAAVRSVTYAVGSTTGTATTSGRKAVSWSAAAVPLAQGPDTITVTARDLLGRTGSASVQVFQAPLVTDQRIIPIPYTGGYPAKGVPLRDPATGLQVTRVADASELTGDYGGHQSAQSLIVYSRYTAVNTTGEYVLVHGDDSTSAWIYRTRDNRMMAALRFAPAQGQASRTLGEVNELRWDYSGAHPYRLYFVGRSLGGVGPSGENVGMSFYETDFDPATGTQQAPVLVHDFSHEFPDAHAEIMNDVEGDSSNDSRYWAWQVMDTSLGSGYLPYAIFAYDRTTDTVTGSIRQDCSAARVPCVAVATPATAKPYLSRPNMVEMSPLGTRAIVDWGRAYTGNRDADIGTVADGPKAFLPTFADPIRIGADETHSGWAWGPNGEELFVSQNDRDDYVEAVDIHDAGTAHCTSLGGNSYSCGTRIVPYALLDGGTWTLGMHFGKVYDRNRRGWVFMSTYDSDYSSWGKNQNLLVQVNDCTVKPSAIVRFGSTYNVHFDYRSEGSGSLDFRGEGVWTTANWGYSDGRGDVFRVQLPVDWYAALPAGQ
ncbi:MAG TPA: hypothetical protein VF457_18355, partial [Burkholderiaceae bacterium]